MFLIRKSQMAALEAAAAEPWVERSARAVAKRWPEVHERMGRAGVCTALRGAALRCAQYGFDDPAQVSAFVEVLFALGDPDFDHNLAWAKAILANRSWSASRKAIELEDALAKELQARVDAQADAEALARATAEEEAAAEAAALAAEAEAAAAAAAEAARERNVRRSA